MGDALRLALLGIVAGAPLTFAATRVLTSQLFGVSAADPAVMTAAVAGLLGIMAAAAGWPAYRASRVDPLTALKADA
jgi:ABC-type antimicrobial peptide transport system permease subunit